MSAAELTAVVNLGTATPDQLDALVEELAEVSCECGHLDHLLDVIRNDGRVWLLRLGPCVARGCECRGGRP